MTLRNAQTYPEVYYGLHFAPGLAEYRDGERVDRILIEEDTIKNMNPTFVGKPVYVQHVDVVNLENIQNEADGYVIDSFWNPTDGKCWAKFIIVSDAGKRALRSGWKLSNAYRPLSRLGGGTWHGVDYSEEITSAEYEHLAIVPNPRYEESVVLSPEEFKKYNDEKQVELKKLANSKDEPKGEKKMAFKFFKKAKVENALDIESTVVELPKSKKELTIADLITQMDTLQNMAGYADPDHMVKMQDGSEMSVKNMCNELEKMRAEKNAASKEGGEPGEDHDEKNSEDQVDEGLKAVDSRGGDEHLENEEEDKEEVKKEEMKKNDVKKKVASLKNAGPKFQVEAPQVLLASDKVALGKSRYGSN